MIQTTTDESGCSDFANASDAFYIICGTSRNGFNRGPLCWIYFVFLYEAIEGHHVLSLRIPDAHLRRQQLEEIVICRDYDGFILLQAMLTNAGNNVISLIAQ